MNYQGYLIEDIIGNRMWITWPCVFFIRSLNKILFLSYDFGKVLSDSLDAPFIENPNRAFIPIIVDGYDKDFYVIKLTDGMNVLYMGNVKIDDNIQNISLPEQIKEKVTGRNKYLLTRLIIDDPSYTLPPA